jgi:hypothetical protein
VRLDIHVRFFKSAPIGPDAIAEARIDRMSKPVIFTTACILDENNQVLVRAIPTAMLKPVAK